MPFIDPKDCHNPVCGSKMDMFNKSLAAQKPEIECPVDRDELGRSTWNLLHTTAAYYPEEPTNADKMYARHLISGLAAHYPCEHCAEDFREAIVEDPPSLGSRTQFALWLCRQHNKVNDKVGKPLFDCTMADIDRRWRYGGPGCWSDDGYAHETLGKDIDD